VVIANKAPLTVHQMNAPSGPSRPLNPNQARSNPAAQSNMTSSFALGNVQPGERMPMNMSAHTMSGPPPPSIQPGQVFRHPGHNVPSPGPALRSTTNPIRPGMMVQPMPVYRQPAQPSSMSPYPSMQQHSSQGVGMPFQPHNQQLRSVTAPVQQSRQPGPQRYELHDRVSSHSIQSSGSDGSRSNLSRNGGSPPIPFPQDPRSTPPSLDSRSAPRSDSLPGSHQPSHSGRSDSISSSAVGSNGVGVSMNSGVVGRNPLAELLESEKMFVERMGLVVRVSRSQQDDGQVTGLTFTANTESGSRVVSQQPATTCSGPDVPCGRRGLQVQSRLRRSEDRIGYACIHILAEFSISSDSRKLGTMLAPPKRLGIC